MTTGIPIDPKRSATHAAKHSCCGGEAAAESRNDALEHIDHECHAPAAPSKVAQSSCCCPASKESNPAD